MPEGRETEPQPIHPNHQPRSQLCFVQHEAHTEVLDPIPLSSCLEPIMSPEAAPQVLI